MATRVVLGQHPTGPYGLFVSRPGYDALSADPNNRSAWVFSSQWQQLAAIIQSGTATTGDNVFFQNLGYIPFIFWEVIVGIQDGYSVSGQPTANNIIFENNVTFNFGWSRYKIFNPPNEAYFRLDRTNPEYDGGTQLVFRYIVFGIRAADYR